MDADKPSIMVVESIVRGWIVLKLRERGKGDCLLHKKNQ
jgi:hypothetical protein